MSFVRETKYVALTVFLALIFSADLVASPQKIDLYKRSLLQQKLGADVKRIYILDARARLVENDVPRRDQDIIIENLKEEFDRTESFANGSFQGALGNTEKIWDSYRGALQTAINTFTGGIGVGEFASLIVDLGKDRYLEDEASGLADQALWTHTERQRHALLRRSRIVDNFMSACEQADSEMRDACDDHLMLDAQVGFDLSDSEESLRKNLDFANFFNNEHFQEMDQKLSDILDSIERGGLTDNQKTELVELILSPLSEGQTEILEKIGANGELVSENGLKINELGVQLSKLDLKNSKVLAQLMRISASTSEYITEQKIREERQRTKELEQADLMAGVNLGLFLIDQIDPKLSRAVSTVVNAQMAISSALEKFGNKSFGELGTLALSMDVVNASMAVIGLFGGEVAPNPQLEYMKAIMEQIQALQEQVAQLREEMHERFDLIDARLVGIESKIDDVYRRIESGFGMVLGQLDSNYNAVILNTNIGLDIQSLIIQENQRIVDVLRQLELETCLDWYEVFLSQIPENIFAECVLKLHQYSSAGIKTDQISNIPTTGASLAEQLSSVSNFGRDADLTYTLFNQISGQPRAVDTMVSEQSWYKASAMYRDFLLGAPELSNKLLRSYAYDELIDSGRAIREFKNSVLDNLTEVNLNELTRISTYSSNIANESLEEILYIYQTAASEYFSELDMNIREIEKPFNESEYGSTPWFDPMQSNETNWIVDNRLYFDFQGRYSGDSDSIANEIFGKLPDDIEIMAQKGLGQLEFELKYIETNGTITPYVDPYYESGPSQYTYGFNDWHVLNIYFHIGSKKIKIADMGFNIVNPLLCYFGSPGSIGCRSDFENRFFFGANGAVSDVIGIGVGNGTIESEPFHRSCLEDEYLSNQCLSTINTQPIPVLTPQESAEVIRNVYQASYARYKDTIINEMIDSFSLYREGTDEVRRTWLDLYNGWAERVVVKAKSSNFNDVIIGANAKIQSIFRFAFSETMTDSDSVFAMANGSLRIPTLNEFAIQAEDDLSLVSYIDDAIDAEAEALKTFYRSNEFGDIVKYTRRHSKLNEFLANLDGQDSMLSASDVNESPSPDISQNEISNSESGGGSIDAYSLSILALLLLANFYRRQFIRRQSW